MGRAASRAPGGAGRRRIRAASVAGEKDTHEFVAYFQKELEGKDVRIHSLNELMAHQDSERQAEHDALVRRHAEQTADLENRLQTADTTATAKIQMLEDELAIRRGRCGCRRRPDPRPAGESATGRCYRASHYERRDDDVALNLSECRNSRAPPTG